MFLVWTSSSFISLVIYRRVLFSIAICLWSVIYSVIYCSYYHAHTQSQTTYAHLFLYPQTYFNDLQAWWSIYPNCHHTGFNSPEVPLSTSMYPCTFSRQRGTPAMVLTYKPEKSRTPEAYTDSNYAGIPNNQKSTFGYVFMHAGGTISWRLELQDCRTFSMIEAK